MMLYPSLDYNNKFHIDHIYPKSKFTKTSLLKKGITQDKVEEYMNHVNDISNLQLLAAIPNIEKQDKDFEEWFAETCPTDTDKIQYRKDKLSAGNAVQLRYVFTVCFRQKKKR